MRKGLTTKIEEIIDDISGLNCIDGYVLCGGTALAMQLGHRQSEDLDFMAWRKSKDEKPEVDWPDIYREIEEKGMIYLLAVKLPSFLCKNTKISEKLFSSLRFSF